MRTKLMFMLMVAIPLLLGFALAQEEKSETSQPNQEVKELEKKVNDLRNEIKHSEDATAYKLLQSDLDKANAEFATIEQRLKQNQEIRNSKQQTKMELESRLKIREEQLQSDPANTDLQNEIKSLQTQLNGKDGSSGLNTEVATLNIEINNDQIALAEITEKRDQHQNQFDAHPLTQKKQELQAAESELSTIKNEMERNRMIQALNEMNYSTHSFSVRKYLSVGHEAEIELFSQEGGPPGLIEKITIFLLQTIGTFAVLLLIVGGYFLITSEGDENRIQKGKNILFYTVLGLILAFSSYIIVQAILSVLFQ